MNESAPCNQSLCRLSCPHPYFCLPTFALNSQSGRTAIAQLNLSLSVLEKTFSIGTSLRLHHATEIRGSM